jgi:hypothetical protein
MPKPTRRERRQLADKGKLAPRRQVMRGAPGPVSAPVARSAVPLARVIPKEDAATVAQEYAYVKADLVRILVLAVVLVGTMIGLRIVLPQ